MEYYSTIKQNEILPFASKWMYLEEMSKISQTERQILHVLPCTWGLNFKNWYPQMPTNAKVICPQTLKIDNLRRKKRVYLGITHSQKCRKYFLTINNHLSVENKSLRFWKKSAPLCQDTKRAEEWELKPLSLCWVFCFSPWLIGSFGLRVVLMSHRWIIHMHQQVFFPKFMNFMSNHT